MALLAEAAEVVERRLAVAKAAAYWLKAKVGDKERYHQGGNEPIAIELMSSLATMQRRIGAHQLTTPPADLPARAQAFLQNSAPLVAELGQALAKAQSSKALHDLFKRMLDELFNKKGASLTSDAAFHEVVHALGVEHSCNMWPGCSYFPGILHCGRLRFVLGSWINKIHFGLAHSVKGTNERPPKGTYEPADGVGDLNKPQHLVRCRSHCTRTPADSD